MKFTLVSAVNNDEVLARCLLDSAVSKAATEVILQRGYSSATKAYNVAIEQAATDVVVLAHQDVFLPDSWLSAFSQAVEQLQGSDPSWAVLGVYGVRKNGEHIGYVYDTGVMRVLGQSFHPAQLVSSLDELLLVVRKSSGVRFDETVTGYHFYGTDICLEAQRRGCNAYAISAFCIHNTNGYRLLPWSFWRNFLLLRRKWWAVLPVTTSCIAITRWCGTALRWNLIRVLNLILKRHKVGRRLAKPAQLYQELVVSGRLTEHADRS